MLMGPNSLIKKLGQLNMTIDVCTIHSQLHSQELDVTFDPHSVKWTQNPKHHKVSLLPPKKRSHDSDPL
jgi:hypothetical protein